MNYQLNPIGKVITKEGKFFIKIDEKFREGLIGLEGFSHVNVLWWGHHCDTEEKKIIKMESPYYCYKGEIGVYATRSSFRPNPIEITAVPIIAIDRTKGLLEMSFIDAEPGTPVIDLKPYYPCADRVKNVQVPKWCQHWPKWYEESGTFDWSKEFKFM